MDTYNFTYRRVKGKCLHCEKLKQRSFFKKMINGAFNRKKMRSSAVKDCELEWRSFEVVGHGPENYTESYVRTNNDEKTYESVDSSDRNRMVLYFKNGALQTISDWRDCELKLDTDWVLFTKSKMERESGQDIKLAVDVKQ